MTEAEPRSARRRWLALREASSDLRRPEARDGDRLVSDRVMRAAVERWTQVAIEAAVDLAYWRIARESWTPPSVARDSFGILAGHGEIPADLAGRLGDAVGLRNPLVHEYADVEPRRLAAIVRDHLSDLEDFAAIAARWLSA